MDQGPRILDRIHYRQDRVGFRDPGYSHLFVVPASSGTARHDLRRMARWCTVRRTVLGGGLKLDAGRKRILFDGLDDPNNDLMYRRSHIYAIDVATGEREMLTDSIGYWTDPVVSPDGKRVVFPVTGSRNLRNAHLFVMDIDGGNSTNLTED